MRAGIIFVGIISVFLGFFLTTTIIGAFLGLPMILLGIVIGLIGLLTSSSPPTVEVHNVSTETQSKDIVEPVKIMVRCNNCGQLNSEEAEYCNKCGKQLKKN